MSVRKFSAKLAVATMAVAGLSVSALGAAQAATAPDGQEKYFDLSNSGLLSNATISSGALIGAGSDTIQFLDGALSQGYNTANSLTVGTSGALTSLSACQPPASGASTLTSCTSSGTFPETFPGGVTGVTLAGSSGSGANLIDGKGNTAVQTGGSSVAFGRGSGVKNAATVDNLPFAVDQLVAVVSNKVASNAPSTITLNELAGIYSGIYTNWAQLGGNNAPIHAYYINDSSSGTYQFFGKQLEAEEGKSTADNGAAAYAPHGTVSASTAFVSSVAPDGTVIKEHDPSAIQSDADAITAMSYSRIKLSAADNGGTPVVKQLGGYIADRAVYTFLRDWVKDGADRTKPALANVPADWITNVPSTAFDAGGAFDSADSTKNPSGETFAQYSSNNLYAKFFGPSGYFCNPAQKSLIEAQGFFQLSSTVCGKDVSSDPALTAADMPSLSKTSGTLPTTGTAGVTQISASVAPKAGTGTPTGSVKFTFIPVNAPGLASTAVSGGSVTATVSGGVATATVPATVPAGKYQVAATYSGDSAFQSSWTDYDVTSGSAPVPSTITIGKPAVAKTLTVPTKVIKVKKGKAVVKVTVTGVTTPVTLTIKSGKKVIAKVVVTKDGVATIKIKAKKLKAGTHKYKVVLAGWPTKTIKIKK